MICVFWVRTCFDLLLDSIKEKKSDNAIKDMAIKLEIPMKIQITQQSNDDQSNNAQQNNQQNNQPHFNSNKDVVVNNGLDDLSSIKPEMSDSSVSYDNDSDSSLEISEMDENSDYSENSD